MSALDSLLGGVSTLALFIVVCVCAAVFFGSLLAWACCWAAKRGDERAEAHVAEQARRQGLIEARRLAVTQAHIAEAQLLGKSGPEMEVAMLNFHYTVAAVQRIDALLDGDEDHARHIEQGQQALVNALRAVESRPEPKMDVRYAEMVSNARWN